MGTLTMPACEWPRMAEGLGRHEALLVGPRDEVEMFVIRDSGEF